VNSPFADLWYHGLAVVGFHGFGPHPLYDAAYGREAARRRPEGMLAVQAARFLTEFEKDPAFEVFHFVPVYFANAGALEALQALRQVASARGDTPHGPSESVHLGMDVVANILATTAQRETLGAFVEALEREWATGLRDELGAAEQVRGERFLALEERWQRIYLPALRPYLSEHGLERGWIVPTPALGLEGRFFGGDPDNADDNVVIVGLADGSANVDETLAPVVRELCFPAVRQAFEQVRTRYADRVAASRASDAAATRCGELLLEARLPAALDAYRSRFRLQGSPAAAWSTLPDPTDGQAWDAALRHVLDLGRGS
jgi:hypothetical protein